MKDETSETNEIEPGWHSHAAWSFSGQVGAVAISVQVTPDGMDDDGYDSWLLVAVLTPASKGEGIAGVLAKHEHRVLGRYVFLREAIPAAEAAWHELAADPAIRELCGCHREPTQAA